MISKIYMTYRVIKNTPRRIKQAHQYKDSLRKARAIKKGNEIMAWPV